MQPPQNAGSASGSSAWGGLPVLFSFRRCPYAMRARLALYSSGITVQVHEVALRSKPPALLAASPKGTVPVLVLPGGAVLDQSLDIMLWALGQHDPQRWLPADAAQKAALLVLIAECDNTSTLGNASSSDHVAEVKNLTQAQGSVTTGENFKHHLDRYKYPNRYALADGLAHRAAGSVFLARLDALLQPTGFLNGLAWGLADAAIAPFVRQWAHTDKAWFAAQPWAALQAWLTGFEHSDAFAVVMLRVGDAQGG